MAYIVHGATGAQGSPVVSAVAATGAEVGALTRRAGAQVASARTVLADARSAEQLRRAYSGSDGVFVHLPLGAPDELHRMAEAVATALAATRPPRVVLSSSGAVLSDPTDPLASPPGSPLRHLVEGLEANDVPYALVEPRLFLENLLLPVVSQRLAREDVLAYPLRADLPVSWSCHADVAQVAAELLTVRTEVVGAVGVGHLPGLCGPDLAQAFAEQVGRQVVFESLAPAVFGQALTPLVGEAAAQGVTALYESLARQEAALIDPARSAQHLLGLSPRSLGSWLEALTR